MGAADPRRYPRPRALGRRFVYWLRSLVLRSYIRATASNYRRRLYAPPKRAGTRRFRSYELVNVHGRDRLLAALLARCRPDDVVVDVGANVGTYSLAVAAERPTCAVHAFEPNPRSFRKLEANVAVNDFSDRVHVHPIGLGDATGEAPFYLSNYHELSSFNRFNAERWEARIVGVVTVRIRRLDDLVADGVVPPPDHLKIDVEGTGHAVLQGAGEVIDRYRPVVYLEPHATDVDERDTTGRVSEDVRTLLDEAGYRLTTHGDAWIAAPPSRVEGDS